MIPLSAHTRGRECRQHSRGYVVLVSGARPVSFDTAASSDEGFKVGDCSEVAGTSNAIKTTYSTGNTP